MDLGLKGKRAIVTGASRGIGRAIAETLASEGVDLAICARGDAGLEVATKSLEAKGVRVFGTVLDVSDGEALKAWIPAAAKQLGGLDLLVSNPSGGNGSDDAAWEGNFQVDLMGAVRSTDAALPFLKESDAASVLFLGTTAAVETFMGAFSYNAIKAAMLTHANGLSQTLAADGIRVNTVSPGPIYFDGGSWDGIRQTMPELYDQTLADCPNGRMGTPEEVANAAVFLLSPAASLISGVNLVVDGAFTKRVNF